MPPQLKPIGLHCSMKYETPFTATRKKINIILRDIPDSTLSALTQKQVIKLQHLVEKGEWNMRKKAMKLYKHFCIDAPKSSTIISEQHEILSYSSLSKAHGITSMDALIRIQNAVFLSKYTYDDASNNNRAYPNATEGGVSKIRCVGGCVLERYYFHHPISDKTLVWAKLHLASKERMRYVFA